MLPNKVCPQKKTHRCRSDIEQHLAVSSFGEFLTSQMIFQGSGFKRQKKIWYCFFRAYQMKMLNYASDSASDFDLRASGFVKTSTRQDDGTGRPCIWRHQINGTNAQLGNVSGLCCQYRFLELESLCVLIVKGKYYSDCLRFFSQTSHKKKHGFITQRKELNRPRPH